MRNTNTFMNEKIILIEDAANSLKIENRDLS
jgi:hypothetical protein